MRRRTGLKMKLTHQRMTGRYDSTPESVLDWLEEQLECRGIDAVVYTRYILSLLQDYDSDDDEEAPPPPSSTPLSVRDMSGFCCDRVVKRHNNYVKDGLKPVATNKWKHRRYRTLCPDTGQDCWPDYNDHQRKLAVVQCLKSASEQEFGIESFVDELCAKLKNIKLLAESGSDVSPEPTPEPTNNNNGVKVSPKEQAMKYYAAFPALDANCNKQTAPAVCKPGPDVSLCQILDKASSDKNKWNGQKIIEFIYGNNNGDGLTADLIDGNQNIACLELVEKKSDKPEVGSVDGSDRVVLATDQSNVKKNFFYCEDIESKVMDVPLVDNQSPNPSYGLEDGIQEENDRFERLVNKFNRNIASIWSTTEADTVLAKSDNIWTFDSSFSSNQSSATPSPKTCSIDLWSSLSIKELNESLSEKSGLCLDFWTASVFKSLNSFTDDGFIDGNPDLFDDNNWRLTSDPIGTEANRTSLQNHQKNSPFIEFNSIVSSNEKHWNRDPDLSSLLSLAACLQQTDNRLSPVLDENLLTSSKTHFQPIRRDSFERDDSEEESVFEMTDKEFNKLVICSDKCPNNSTESKGQQTTAYDTFKHRPISTSFGELASFMGPFTDFEWGSTEYPQQLTADDDKCRQMRDKSTNTESESPIDLKSGLASIVNTSAECEPEYQDLYQMINEVLSNGLSDDDSTPVGTCSLAASDDDQNSFGCKADQKSGGDLLFTDTDSMDRLFVDSNLNCQQRSVDLEPSPSDYTVDEIFAEELAFRQRCGLFDNCDELFDDSLYGGKGCPYPQSLLESSPFDSQLDVQYNRRHQLQNVGLSSSRVQKPCTFFIEGNCKRSDCKYSHQISAITCKYWEEGFCFKAELCPFLHGYVDDQNEIQMNGSSVDSKTYAIGSESDFPSLEVKCLDNEELDWMASQVDPMSGDCLEQHFFDFRTKSVTDGSGTVGPSKAKLPIAVFMKKKLRKRKDRNLQ